VSVRASAQAPYQGMIAILDQIKMSRQHMPDGREITADKISLVPTME